MPLCHLLFPCVCLVFACLTPASPGAAQVEHDPDAPLPDYVPVETIQGRLHIYGDDSLINIHALIAEPFSDAHPELDIHLSGAGSTSPEFALAHGWADLTAMLARQRDNVHDIFIEEQGYAPTDLLIGHFCLGIIVHPSNPIESITPEQLRELCIIPPELGPDSDRPMTWGQLGLEGEWAERVTAVWAGHQGRYMMRTLFHYLRVNFSSAPLKQNVRFTRRGEAFSREHVAEDPAALGLVFVNLNGMEDPRFDEVKFVPVRRTPDDPAVLPSPETVWDGSYPLVQAVYTVVDLPPEGELAPVVREYVRLIYSPQGQAVIAEDGGVPVSPAQARAEAAKVGIDLDHAIPAAEHLPDTEYAGHAFQADHLFDPIGDDDACLVGSGN